LTAHQSVLPATPANEKARAIRDWIKSLLERIEHCKAEQYALLEEAMTLLELALWKANLLDKNEEYHSLGEEQPNKTAR
jgi:hypothetical protein